MDGQPGARLRGGAPGRARTLRHPVFARSAAALGAARAALEAAGLTIRTGAHPVLPSRTMYVDDPVGHEVGFIAPAE